MQNSPQLLSPTTFKHWLTQYPNPCLFLDIDGTLSPFEIDPSASKIPTTTLALLKTLQALGLPIAIVTGRSLAEAQQLLQGIDLPIGATHGLEIATAIDSKNVIEAGIQKELPLIVRKIEQQITEQGLQNYLLEKKPYSVALHYRQNPNIADTVATLMQNVTNNFAHWQVKSGKFVWEILPKGADKGTAVTALWQHFNSNQASPYCPIFIGDDISDEAGFLAVQAVNGIGIKVAKPVDYASHAHFFVDNIDHVTKILAQLVTHYQNKLEPTV